MMVGTFANTPVSFAVAAGASAITDAAPTRRYSWLMLSNVGANVAYIGDVTAQLIPLYPGGSLVWGGNDAPQNQLYARSPAGTNVVVWEGLVP